jgi:adenine deaminase
MLKQVMSETTLEEKIAVGAGLEKADLVLKGGKVFNVFTGKWEVADIAVSGTTIAGVGEYSGRKEYDVCGKYLTPGFLDAHVHIESSMLAPRELAKVLLLNGVTGIFADPHEIANVFGLEGVRFMLRETEDIPLSVYFLAPSCVPATNMETSGACLKAEDLQQLLQEERVLGLGEMMNYPGVLQRLPEVMAKLTLSHSEIKDGHAPGLRGKSLNGYIDAGINSDHEAYLPEEALEKLARGMYVLLREGSAAHNLLDLLPMVKKTNCRRCCLATDDRHLDDLITKGSINYMVEIGVTHGYSVEKLLTMATLNTAERFHRYDLGALAPGYQADINVFNNLVNFQPETVLKSGQVIVRKKQLQWDSVPVSELPPSSMDMEEVTAQSFKIIPEEGKLLQTIVLNQDQLLTGKAALPPLVKDGNVVSNPELDLLKMAVCERHHHTGKIGLGFVQGFKLKRGALASTVAHDSHNLIVIGTNDKDMAFAANVLREAGGGLVAVEDGRVLGSVPLPVAGLMSEGKADVVFQQLKELNHWTHELGVPEDINVFMLLSFLALPVIPSLKLSDQGLIDVDNFCKVPLWTK